MRRIVVSALCATEHMNATLTYLLAALVLPPTSTTLLAALGIVLIVRRWRRLGIWVLAVSISVLWLLATPWIGIQLLHRLEPAPLSVEVARASEAQAIVILGGGRALAAPEWGGETVNAHTLARLRYGAALAKALSLPVLVSGGMPGGGLRSEAVLMRDALSKEWGVSVEWLEDKSMNTRENARLSARLLQPLGIKHIILVTEAAHMPRAQANFAAQGFSVMSAPTAYLGQHEFGLNLLVPSVEGLRRSNIALREWLATTRDQYFE